jgi:hypothetical protein
MLNSAKAQGTRAANFTQRWNQHECLLRIEMHKIKKEFFIRFNLYYFVPPFYGFSDGDKL